MQTEKLTGSKISFIPPIFSANNFLLPRSHGGVSLHLTKIISILFPFNLVNLATTLPFIAIGYCKIRNATHNNRVMVSNAWLSLESGMMPMNNERGVFGY